jgi:hypothetical protein
MSRIRSYTSLDTRTYQDRKTQDELTGFKRKQGIRLKESSWDTIDHCRYSLPQIIEMGVRVVQEIEKRNSMSTREQNPWQILLDISGNSLQYSGREQETGTVKLQLVR